MANLSNINNKLLVGTNGEVRIGDTATVADVKLRVKQTAQQWTAQFVNTDSSVAYGISIDTSASSYGVAGTLQCYTNSGGGFIVRNDSRVGIGTSSPQRLLQLRSTNEATGIFLERTSNYGFVQYNQIVGSVETYHLGFVNNNTFSSDILVANESGKVGIGEASPLGKLHVKTSDTGVTTPSAQGNLLVLEDSENGLSILSSTAGAGYINFGDSDDNDIGMIIYGHSTNSMDFWTNAGKRMTIDNVGNVGIGVVPETGMVSYIKQLRIGEQSALQGHADSVGQDSATWVTTNFKFGTSGGQFINGTVAAPGYAMQYQQQVGDHTFSTSNAAGVAGAAVTFTVQMVIKQNGNVGIGTTSPVGKLQVSLPTYTNEDTNSQQAIFGVDSGYGVRIGYNETDNKGYINVLKPGVAWGSLILQEDIGKVGIGTTSPQTKLEVNGGLIKIVDSGDTAFYGGDYVRVFGTQSYGFRNSAGSAIAQISLTGNSYFNGGNVGIGVTNPQDKLHVNGDAIISSTRFGDFATASINTTGFVVATVAASTNGQSAIVEFVASGNNAAYYNVVYSCYNGGGAWFYNKNVVGSGGNIEVAETNGSGSSTLSFSFRATSGSASYTPRVMMKGMPYNLVTF